MSFSTPKIDVLLIQKAEVQFYPPVINQLNILAESGIRVGLLDGGNAKKFQGLNENIIRFSTYNYNFTNEYYALKFIRLCAKIIKESKTKICIVFDPSAAAVLGFIPYSGIKIFHFHEYPGDPDGVETLKLILQNKLATFFARRGDMVISPDSHRASTLYKEYNLSRLPRVVRNCPRRIIKLPRGILKNRLAEMDVKFEHIVLFQGSVSRNYYADNIITSMQFWPKNTVMAFIGPVKDGFKNELRQYAIKLGVSNRLIFLGQIPYNDLFSYTVDADLAFTMIKPVTFNFTHMAGASNKRYEMMACGIPQICNKGPGMQELVEDNNIGLCINADDAAQIGGSATELLLNKDRREMMSVAARELHLRRFNYEREYEPVLRQVLEWSYQS